MLRAIASWTRAQLPFRPCTFTALLTGILLSAAVSAQPTAPRQRLNEVASYLGLSSEQHRQLRDLDAGLRSQFLQTRQQAARVGSTERAALCERSRQQQRQTSEQARALLNEAQLARLGTLEQALSLLPAIESAQAAHLLPDELALPPVGLPQGQIEVPVRLIRSSPLPLPGCPAAPQTLPVRAFVAKTSSPTAVPNTRPKSAATMITNG